MDEWRKQAMKQRGKEATKEARKQRKQKEARKKRGKEARKQRRKQGSKEKIQRERKKGRSLPLHFGFIPFHFPLARHFLIGDPIKQKPSSHLNLMIFGKTVFFPIMVPFIGAKRGPQSLANSKITKMNWLVNVFER